MPAIIDILLFSLSLSLVLTLLTKVLTNQKEVKEIKRKMAGFRQQIKDAQKDGGKGDQVKHLSDEMFKTSKSQFKYSTKSMFVSMIVVIIAFGWLQANYDKLPVAFQTGVNQTSLGSDGIFKYKGQEHTVQMGVGDEIFIDKNQHKLSEFIVFEDIYLKAATDAGKPVLTVYAVKSPVGVPYIGSYLSWFWLYVLITLPSTLIFRKLLDVE